MVEKAKCKKLEGMPLDSMTKQNIIDHLEEACCPVLKSLTRCSEEVTMPKDEYVEEHKRLVKVLETGTKAEQKKEAKRQKQDVKDHTHTR